MFYRNKFVNFCAYIVCSFICFFSIINLTNAQNFDLISSEKNEILINKFEFLKDEINENFDEKNEKSETKNINSTYYINADFEFTLHKNLEEALHRGINLNFVAEFTLQKPRKYWFDKHILHKKHSLQLSYHPIQREYRLNSYQPELLGLSQTFSTLSDVLRVIKHLRRWQVISANDVLTNGETYSAMFLVYLDNSQLPKPFQISIIGDKTWQLSSDIKKWNFTYNN